MAKNEKLTDEERLAKFVADSEAAPVEDEGYITEKMREENKSKLLNQMKSKVNENNPDTFQRTVPIDSGYTGFINVLSEDLPTKGRFYPTDFRILIRAATAGEIRHWSMTSDDNILQIDESMNYIISRCVKITGEEGQKYSWKDLKEIDRFYIILAIRDITFPEGNNDLKMQISEGNSVSIHKDHVNFVEFDEKLMKHYSQEDRCFVFKTKDHELKINLPSLGLTQWLKSYLMGKNEERVGIDREFAVIAPFIIDDYRGLNDIKYSRLVNEYVSLGVFEHSLLAQIKDLITSSISPTITYVDEAGADQTAPLTFLGGFKSLFLIQDPLSFLD